jgi:hypothetical protein
VDPRVAGQLHSTYCLVSDNAVLSYGVSELFICTCKRELPECCSKVLENLDLAGGGGSWGEILVLVSCCFETQLAVLSVFFFVYRRRWLSFLTLCLIERWRGSEVK